MRLEYQAQIHVNGFKRGTLAWLLPVILLFAIAACASPEAAPTDVPPWQTNTPPPTATPTPIPPPTATATMEPTPFGGGGKIAFSSDRDGNFEIYMMNPDGTNQIRLTNQSSEDFFPEFSPDGEMLLFSAIDLNSDPILAEFQFAGVDGSHLGTFGVGTGSASWSPDNKSVAWAVYVSEGNEEIAVGVFGEGVRYLTSDASRDYEPAWSPDGRRLAFVSRRDGLPKIYLMDANGDNQRRLTESDLTEFEPAWSPDGTKIAFVSGDDVNTQIFIMNADGTEIVQVTEGLGYNEHPTWSPDGTTLAFWANRSGNPQIYIIHVDGSGLARVTSNSFNEENPDWTP